MSNAAHGATVVQPDPEALKSWIGEVGVMLRRAEFNVPKANASDFLTLFGVCAQSIRYAEAYLTLLEAGQAREAMVLSRAALEHAVTAQWCYFTSNGVQRLRRKQLRLLREYGETMANWLDNDELRVLASEILVEDEPFPNFYRRIMGRLDQNNFLKTSYINLSRSTHVGDSTTSGFLRLQEGVYSLDVDSPPPFVFPGTYVAAIAASLSIWLIETLACNEEALDYLDATSDRLAVPIFLSHDPLTRLANPRGSLHDDDTEG